MIGYWKGGVRPIFTTGDNFLTNFNFLVPGSLGLLAIILPIFFIQSIISPNHEFVYDGSEYNDHYLKITYSGDKEVSGHISWTYYESDKPYRLESNFVGVINNNQVTINLEDTKVRCSSVLTPIEINKIQTLYLNDGSVTFNNLVAVGD